MSKVKFYFDKKQMPQIVALSVLSIGMLGYFSLRMLTPPLPEKAVAGARKTSAVGKNPIIDEAQLELASLTDGNAPSLDMRDPFISAAPPATSAPANNSTTTFTTSLNQTRQTLGVLQPLPFSSAIRPLTGLTPGSPSFSAVSGVAPVVSWSVTGVLTGPDSSSRIAILRNGDARRFVPLGDMVDDQYRLIGIDRFGVTLAQGKNRVRLRLGENVAKPTGAAPAPIPAETTGNAVQPSAAGLVAGTAAVNQLTKEINGGVTPQVN
jgi:hypothetical protein